MIIMVRDVERFNNSDGSCLFLRPKIVQNKKFREFLRILHDLSTPGNRQLLPRL